MKAEETNQESVEEVTEQPEQIEETPEQTATQEPESTETPVPQDNEVDGDFVEIGGEKYKVDEVLEWQKGNMRQSDYTKKTQELSRKRKEQEEAIEFYEYIKNNPHIAKQLQSADIDDDKARQTAQNLTPEMQMIKDLQVKLADQDLDKELSSLKEKYPDFDEVKILSEAEKRGIDDLEFIYKATREEGDKVDAEKIKQEAIAEAKAQIMKEIEQNKQATETIINKETEQNQQVEYELTAQEKKVATGMGLSVEEYAKWAGKTK